jgi:hypothetical protein
MRFNPWKEKQMKTPLIAVLSLAFAGLVASAHAADAASAPAAKPKTAQQEKMAKCNADAKDKKGDERKAFMKECLSAKSEAAGDAKTAQQNKMKTCSADFKASGKPTGERKAFMSECLKK